MEIETAAAWREFESAKWHEAVRYRSLELRSLDADERRLVFEFITSDLERRKRSQPEYRLGGV
jgi:hypothetical protein